MRIAKLIAFLLPAAIVAGCYNDKYDKLYPTGTVACDTSTITYASDIQPIFNAKCNTAGCHDATASGGYTLTTHAGSQVAVNSGKLLGSVTWTTGFSAMPKNLPKLSDCEINKITRWINQGAPNN
ncbi:MAG: hypothetical protein KF744_10360 [Taibaiella sp.]|nr:hypothetical protein [Taibaiella sp.]